MLAVRAHEGGGVVSETVPDPVPGKGEVVVELRFAGVNRRDCWISSGTYPYRLPLILGSDGAGIRRDTGEEVVIYPGFGWPRGADHPPQVVEILGGPRDGTFAELVSLPTENLFPKPSRLSWEEAAAFPLAAVTAYRALFSRARLRRGETVLVLGAASGVSTLTVQLAAQAGADVLVTSSSDEKIERAKELGARAGINYATTRDWPAAVMELGGADVVVDSVGSTWQMSLECLRIGGRLVVLGATGGTEVPLQVRNLYFQHISLLGTMLGGPDEMDGLLRMVESGSWHPVIDSVRPLSEAADVLDRLVTNVHFGKVVLACS